MSPIPPPGGIPGWPLGSGRSATAPISFVSEHSETLVELDLDYRDLAVASGVPAYHRVPTVGTEPGFIRSLAMLVRRACVEGSVGSCNLRSPHCVLSKAGV